MPATVLRKLFRLPLWLTAIFATSIAGLNPAGAASALPSVDSASFASQPARLDSGVMGKIVRFQSANPTEWGDLLGGRHGSPVELTAQIFTPFRVVQAYRQPSFPMRPRQQRTRRCCQSNRNSSPIDASLALSARPQAKRDCHSASAAERRSL